MVMMMMRMKVDGSCDVLSFQSDGRKGRCLVDELLLGRWMERGRRGRRTSPFMRSDREKEREVKFIRRSDLNEVRSLRVLESRSGYLAFTWHLLSQSFFPPTLFHVRCAVSSKLQTTAGE